jgi:DNA-binding CsgD family transcriptional regulator
VGIASPRAGGLPGWAHGPPFPSVTYVFLLRDVVSARTWLAAGSVLAGCVTGLAAFLVIIIGVSAGIGTLAAALAGVLVFGCVLRFDEYFARFERARLGLMLGARLPGWPASARAGYRWGIVPRWRTLSNRAAWSEFGYALVRSPLGSLTPREREVLALMAEGRSNPAIAAGLVVGAGAVEKHINNIFAKLGLAPADGDNRRVIAVLRYLETG